jgi:hypothetical protein
MNRLLVPFLFAAVSVQMAHATGDWASAPKGLDHYVDRLPAKSLSQLLIESAAKDGSGTQEGSYRFTSDDIEWQIKNLVDFGPEATREGKLAECEQILAYLRSDPASSFAWVNLVLDLRDCLADAKRA